MSDDRYVEPDRSMELSLSGSILLQLQDSSEISLPSLKVLQLIEVDDLDAKSLDILLSRCPILENLKLFYTHYSFAILRLQSSLLKRLEITIDNDAGGCLEIDAPGLKYLSLRNFTFSNAAAVGNLPNVKKADLARYSTPKSESVYPLLNLLRNLSGIKHLKMGCSITEVTEVFIIYMFLLYIYCVLILHNHSSMYK
uniref:F-box/FBD/LRR-repeat protein At5g44950 n=1 Tax=Cicer arietinum TaxID=3827 RepID=A0A3Q7YC76_CICAR|nr:putative F-box/FBD/LRR-repeat protein At5g44950 [Cicer arietinum]